MPVDPVESFGDNRLRRLALDSGFSRCARLVAGRPNGAPCGRSAGLPVAGRIARREGPRCQGLAEKLGTVAEAVFVYYKGYKPSETL